MGGIGLTFGRGTIFAIANGADIGAAGTEANEILADGVGPFLAEGEIVLRSAPSVGVTRNNDFGVGVVAEVVGQLVELGALLGFDSKTVVSEKDRFRFEGFVVGGVGVAGAFGESLVVNIVGAIAKSGAVALLIGVGASRKDGKEGKE